MAALRSRLPPTSVRIRHPHPLPYDLGGGCKLKRLTRVLVCAALMASSLIMPVGAWDKYSFVGDSVYFGTPVSDVQLYSVDAQADSSSSSSLVGDDFVSKWVKSSDTSSLGVNAVFHYSYDNPYGPDVDQDIVRMYPEQFLVFPIARVYDQNRVYAERTISIPYDIGNGNDSQTLQSIVGVLFGPDGFSGPGTSARTYVQYDYIPSDSITAFSLHGEVWGGPYIYQSGYRLQGALDRVEVLVDGAPVRSFYPGSDGHIDFADFIYSSSSVISTVSFRVYPSSFSFSVPSNSDYSAVFGVSFFYSDNFQFDALIGDSILDGYVDNAQDSINDWDEIESGFGDSATSDFDDLGIDDFEYPSGFIGAFTLVSGIFSDLFNCMGDFRIIYILPLTLGICFLLIGRVSRTSVPAPPKAPDLPVNAPALNAPKHPVKR